MNGAFVACPAFLISFLTAIGVPRPDLVDGVRSRVEYSLGDSTSQIDVYLWRDEPTFKVALELKRAEEALREEQIRDYLKLLKIIQPDGRLQQRRDAPRNAKVVAITGATEVPEAIERIKKASSGKMASHVEWISWYRLVDILDDVCLKEDSPSLRYLTDILSELGYVPANSSLPALKTYQRILSGIVDVLSDDSIESEMEVLETTLGRVEYEMSKLGYGVTLKFTKNGRRRIATRQRVVKLKSISLFGGKIYTLGRAFLPITVIQESHRNPKRAGPQDAGVGIAYSIPSTSWVAFILPEKGRPLPDRFIEALSTQGRTPIDRKVEGFSGWALKGDQKRPRSVARFLKLAWDTYDAPGIPLGEAGNVASEVYPRLGN